MPFINTKTNIKITMEQETAVQEQLSKAASATLGKGENWIMTGYEDECTLYFHGDNTQPTAFVDVSIYGGDNPAAFDRLTGKICEIYGSVLGIAADRIFVKYTPVSNWGWNGGNF